MPTPGDKIGSIACEIEPSLAARVAAATKGVDSDAVISIMGDVAL